MVLNEVGTPQMEGMVLGGAGSPQVEGIVLYDEGVSSDVGDRIRQDGSP